MTIANYNTHKKRQIANGRNYGWNPKDPERERVANSLTTKRDRHVGNFIIEHPKSESQGDTGLILAGDLNKDGYLEQMNRVYDPDGLAPTLHCRTGGGDAPKD